MIWIIAILATIVLLLLGVVSGLAPGSKSDMKGCVWTIIVLWIIGLLIYGGFYWW